ncbi:MAG TPA: hypothetical protein VGB90_06765 [Alphaproteobacteria bacterium]|jgi:hypothetical protein
MTLRLAYDEIGNPIQALRPGTAQNIAFDATSQQNGTAFDAGTRVLRLRALTADCYYKIGANPTAAADGTSVLLGQGEREFVRIEAGEKIAAIRAAGVNGTLNIAEMS